MPATSLPIDIKRLSIAERILLVEEIWDSIVEENAALPPTQDQQVELDRRLRAMADDPAAGNTWDAIKNSLLEKE